MNNNFSFSTIKNFDNHIKDSISNYDILHNLVLQISEFFIKKNSIVYDIGCSTGKLVQELREKSEGVVIGIEKDKNIIEAEDILNADIRDVVLKENSSLILSIFTLQFIDVKHREYILQKIYNSLHIGGALIIAEKTYSENGLIQEIFTFSNYDYKKNNFTSDEILQKEKDIRKIMKPLTEKENIKMFENVGFKKIDVFYKSLNFVGWVLVK